MRASCLVSVGIRPGGFLVCVSGWGFEWGRWEMVGFGERT